ncbi:MAG: type IV pilus modification protein PilV [Deltaproteobacteria bacterium]|nr:type IV pilus modification protein PilV [Deltaproteobacteria bacterium]
MKGVYKQRGFTLIEVLVAMLLLTVGLMSALNMQSTAILGNKGARDMTVATNMAAEIVERMRISGKSYAYNDLDTDADCPLADPVKGDCEQWKSRLNDPDIGLVRARGRVSVVSGVPYDRLTTATVTVTWFTNREKKIVYETIIRTW